MKKHILDPRERQYRALCGRGEGRIHLTEDQAMSADHRDLCVRCQRLVAMEPMQRYRRRQAELEAKGA